MAGDFITPIHLGHSEEKGVARGAEAIARAVGVERHTILCWKKAGAPIYLVGGKYQCRYDELWTWIGENEKQLPHYRKLYRKKKKKKR